MIALFDELGSELPGLFRAHVQLAASALALAIVIAMPIVIASRGRPGLRGPILGTAGLIQTVPTLALLALFYPALLALGQLSGLAIPALGFLPALLALTLYALLPILRNGVAALDGIAPGIIEAADAIGMNRRQRLLIVELPLAAPVIFAGIRVAAVWTIGGATLATTVGQPSLGNLIFAGLQTESWSRVLVGCFAAALLALAADGLLGLVETGLRVRSRVRLLVAAVLLAIGLGLAWMPVGFDRDSPVVVVGAKNFSEQYILADVMARRLDAAGYRVVRREDLGSAIAYRALAAGDVDAYVDYTGTLWANVLGRSDIPPPAVMRATLSRTLATRDGVRLLGPLGFENAYGLAMRRDRAAALGIRSLDDLARQAPSLRLASDLEFLSRPEWRGVAKRYGLRFAEMRPYNPTFMYRALASGSADAISAFSSDGRIAALDLVTLADPRGALPSYDAVLLLSPRASKDARIIQALLPLIGAVPIDRMRRANLMVDRDTDKRTPAEAGRWLLP